MSLLSPLVPACFTEFVLKRRRRALTRPPSFPQFEHALPLDVFSLTPSFSGNPLVPSYLVFFRLLSFPTLRGLYAGT